MLIAILSDVHDNWANLEKVLKYLKKQKIKTILCLGDLCAPSTLKMLVDNFKGKIHYVFGNVEGDLYQTTNTANKYKNVILYGQELGELSIDGKRIAITHWPKTASALAKTGDYDLVFFGHTHRPDIKKFKPLHVDRGIILANPGNIAGLFYKPSFAIYNTKTGKLELKILDNMSTQYKKEINF